MARAAAKTPKQKFFTAIRYCPVPVTANDSAPVFQPVITVTEPGMDPVLVGVKVTTRLQKGRSSGGTNTEVLHGCVPPGTAE